MYCLNVFLAGSCCKVWFIKVKQALQLVFIRAVAYLHIFQNCICGFNFHFLVKSHIIKLPAGWLPVTVFIYDYWLSWMSVPALLGLYWSHPAACLISLASLWKMSVNDWLLVWGMLFLVFVTLCCLLVLWEFEIWMQPLYVICHLSLHLFVLYNNLLLNERVVVFSFN